jgi:hypothetical protein
MGFPGSGLLRLLQAFFQVLLVLRQGITGITINNDV